MALVVSEVIEVALAATTVVRLFTSTALAFKLIRLDKLVVSIVTVLFPREKS